SRSEFSSRPRREATASISSINTIQGAAFLALAYNSRTRRAPVPTYFSTKSEHDAEKKGTPASPAIAFANNVLPVPGGPYKITPRGSLAPISRYLSGDFRQSTILITSCFSPSTPSTSENFTDGTSNLFAGCTESGMTLATTDSVLVFPRKHLAQRPPMPPRRQNITITLHTGENTDPEDSPDIEWLAITAGS